MAMYCSELIFGNDTTALVSLSNTTLFGVSDMAHSETNRLLESNNFNLGFS